MIVVVFKLPMLPMSFVGRVVEGVWWGEEAK
jgi:hypothetical protein